MIEESQKDPWVSKDHHNLGSSRPGGNEGEEDRKSHFASIINAGLSLLQKRNGGLNGGKWEFRFFRNYFSSTTLDYS